MDHQEIRKTYKQYIPELLEKQGIHPTHFVTLIFNKNVPESVCESAFNQFLLQVKKRVYGRHSKRREVKHISVLENNYGGNYHIHSVMECQDEWKYIMRDIWSNRIRTGSRIGISEDKDWFVPIYDEDDLYEYLTKYLDTDKGQLIL